MGHEYRTILLKGVIMKIIRDMQEYNSMLAEIKAVMAAETVTNYKIMEDRNVGVYGGAERYDHSSYGAYIGRNGTFSTEYHNTIWTTGSVGNFCEAEIPNISKDVALRAITLALKEAFSVPEPDDDSRLLKLTTIVEINDHVWYVSFQD